MYYYRWLPSEIEALSESDWAIVYKNLEWIRKEELEASKQKQ